MLSRIRNRHNASRSSWPAVRRNGRRGKISLANIGIMADPRPHIKNLPVRPNDLLHRCLEADGMSTDQRECSRSSGTHRAVTQRLQRFSERSIAILESEPVRLDLNLVTAELGSTWRDLARERWKLQLDVLVTPEPLWIEMDVSQLQQALENLLFNARDAVAEMRGLRQAQVRQDAAIGSAERRSALIAAAGWVGKISLRTRRQDRWAVLEVKDDGVGMNEEIRERCTEPHFSTKRHNALFEGNATGMGLGLSFVAAILKSRRAMLEIESQPS